MALAARSETSPDGRLRIDWLPHPDPRTATEAEGWWGVELIDVTSGAVLTELQGAHEWPAEGGIRMQLRQIWVTVAPDLQSFTVADEPGRIRPIGELEAWRAARWAEAQRRAAGWGKGRPAPKRFEESRTAFWLSLLALIALWGGLIVALVWGVWRAISAFLAG